MAQRELTAADYMAMFRRRWVLIVIFAVIGPPLGYAASLILPARYESQTLVLVQQPTVPTDFVKPVDTTDISQRLASMQQQILSRSRLEPIIRQFGLYPKDLNRVSIDDLVARLQKAVEVTPVKPMEQTEQNHLPGFFIKVTGFSLPKDALVARPTISGSNKGRECASFLGSRDVESFCEALGEIGAICGSIVGVAMTNSKAAK